MAVERSFDWSGNGSAAQAPEVWAARAELVRPYTIQAEVAKVHGLSPHDAMAAIVTARATGVPVHQVGADMREVVELTDPEALRPVTRDPDWPDGQTARPSAAVEELVMRRWLETVNPSDFGTPPAQQ